MAERPGLPSLWKRKRISKMNGNSTRIGTYKCYVCRKPFTVKVGTIFEDSHIPMRLWLQAIYLMSASKKGISSNQLHRTLGVTLKTAWFMAHRIRYAMEQGPKGPFRRNRRNGRNLYRRQAQGRSASCQARRFAERQTRHTANKAVVVSLVQRGGSVPYHIEKVTAENLKPIVDEMVAKDAHLMTDTSTVLDSVGVARKHSKVNHKEKEYVRNREGQRHYH